MESERDSVWDAFEANAARNRDKDPEEIERDVANEIEAMRRERRAAEVATINPDMPRADS